MSIQNGLPLAEREPDEGPGLDDQQQSALESFGVARVQSDRYVVTSLPQLARWEAPCHSLGQGCLSRRDRHGGVCDGLASQEHLVPHGRHGADAGQISVASTRQVDSSYRGPVFNRCVRDVNIREIRGAVAVGRNGSQSFCAHSSIVQGPNPFAKTATRKLPTHFAHP